MLLRIILLLTALLPAAASYSSEEPAFEPSDLIVMDPKYIGSDRENVYYFDDEHRDQARLTIQDGLLYNSKGRLANHLFERDFVIAADGSLYSVTQNRFVGYHHSSPVEGQPVIFAGTMAIKKGKIRSLSNNSGHYKPNADEFLNALKYLQAEGLDLSETEIEFVRAPPLGRRQSAGSVTEFMKSVEETGLPALGWPGRSCRLIFAR